MDINFKVCRQGQLINYTELFCKISARPVVFLHFFLVTMKEGNKFIRVLRLRPYVLLDIRKIDIKVTFFHPLPRLKK